MAAEHERTFDSSEPVGSLLKRTRLSQRKTHEEIARTTRIPASTLKAIEEGEDGKLPAEVFLRGFVKIYAQHLGLDPDVALNSYFRHLGESYSAGKELKDRMPSAQEFFTNDAETDSASSPVLRVLFFISLLVLFGLLAYWGYTVLYKAPATENVSSSFQDAVPSFPGNITPEEQTDVAATGSETTGDTLPDYTPYGEPAANTATDQAQASVPAETGAAPLPGALPGQSPGAENTAPVVPGAPAVAEIAAGTPSVTAAGTAADEASLASETTVSSPAPLTINPDKQKIDLGATEYALKAEFLEPTWLKIDIDGSRTREYTFKPGDHLSWRAQKSIRLVVGNAGGVALTLNGEKLPPIGPSGKPATITLPKEVP